MHPRYQTGVPGLDPVLGGGLLPESCVLISGEAGTGKTTLGLQFLCAGAAEDTGGVYITFEELPEQIYRDAATFGWDLPALERAGRLQVVCTAPETLVDEAETVGGLLEELQAEVGMRRAVIDSLNLVLPEGGTDHSRRQVFYRLRNAFRRLGVTALFLHELTNGAVGGPEAFVADTLVHLSHDSVNGHRIRHLEVRKHRGSTFLPGQHVFVFTDSGIRLLPALNRIPDVSAAEVVPTGLGRLDACLGGGLLRGATFALNVNSKCNYRYLLGTMIAAHLERGDGLLTGRLQAPLDLANLLQGYGYDLARLGASGRFLAFDFAGRPAPSDLEPYMIRLRDTPEDHEQVAAGAIMRRFRGEEGTARHWLHVVDVNTVILKLGQQVVMREWPDRVGAAHHYGHTIIALCNFDEMGPAMTSFLQRTAAGVLQTWFDGRYQYLQVQKAPNGRLSEPMVVEYTEQPPFIVLW